MKLSLSQSDFAISLVLDLDLADTVDVTPRYSDVVTVLNEGTCDELASAWLDMLDAVTPYSGARSVDPMAAPMTLRSAA